MKKSKAKKNSDWVWVVIGIVTLCALFWPVVEQISDFFNFGECGVTDTRHLLSPNGAYDLIIKELDCGATVSTIYEYSIVKAGHPPDDHARFLRIDHGRPAEEAFRWETNDNLKAYIPGGRIWEEKKEVGIDSGANVNINLRFSPTCEHIKRQP